METNYRDLRTVCKCCHHRDSCDCNVEYIRMTTLEEAILIAEKMNSTADIISALEDLVSESFDRQL